MTKIPDEITKPTELTRDDIDKFFNKLITTEIKSFKCVKCSNDFYRNYDMCLCDECYFAQFPKEVVERFCRSFLE